MELLDETHRQLAPRLTAAGFELADEDNLPGEAPAWIEYRNRQDGTTRLLSLTANPDGLVLAEYWRTPIAGQQPEVMQRAWWRCERGHETALIPFIVNEIDRWLQALSAKNPPSP